jgi:hypothetical protein
LSSYNIFTDKNAAATTTTTPTTTTTTTTTTTNNNNNNNNNNNKLFNVVYNIMKTITIEKALHILMTP